MRSPFLRRFGMPSPFFDNETGFSPAALFALAEPGIWLDPSDLSTMFQDRAGSTAVTTPGQEVGLRLDKSKGLVLGSELVTNGDFSVDANWNKGVGWSISGGSASIDGTNVAASVLTQTTISTTVGMTYLVSFSYSVTAGSIRLNTAQFGTTSSIAAGTSGVFTARLEAIGATGNFSVQAQTAGTIASVDNITVRELRGNHAKATADLNRGIYGVEPLGGRRNLLERTEDFGNAAWVLFNVSGSASRTGSTITFGANATDRFTQSGRTIQSGAHTVSVILSGTGEVRLYLLGGDGSTGAPNTITLTGTPTRYTLTRSPAAGGSFGGIGIYNNAAGTPATVTLSEPQLETGSTATAYQRVVDQYNVTQAGVPTLHYVQYDGSNDTYLTPTIDPLGTAPELVANGNFSGGTTTGWTPNNATLSVVSGALRVTVTTGGSAAWASTTIATVPGRTYSVSATLVADAATGNSFVYAGTISGGASLMNLNVGSTLGTYGGSFVAVGTTTFISVGSSSVALAGETLDWDNISVKDGVSDKVQVFTGIRKLSDATRAVFLEWSTASSNNGTFAVEAPAVATEPRFTFFSRGTVAVSPGVNNAIYAAPITQVMTGLGDISGDVATVRLNGTQVSRVTADQGMCNYLAYPLYIGRRNDASFPFNGRDYGIIVRFGANLTATQIADTEVWMNQRTGAY